MALNNAQLDVISNLQGFAAQQANAARTARALLMQMKVMGLLSAEGLPLVTKEELASVGGFAHLKPEDFAAFAALIVGTLTASDMPIPGAKYTSAELLMLFGGSGALK